MARMRRFRAGVAGALPRPPRRVVPSAVLAAAAVAAAALLALSVGPGALHVHASTDATARLLQFGSVTSPDSAQRVHASTLAADAVNAGAASSWLLPGVTLVTSPFTETNRTGPAAARAVLSAHRTLADTDTPVVGVVDGGSSGIALPTALVTSVLGTPQTSPSASTPRLSDTETFPRFTRLGYADGKMALVMLQVLASMEWRHVALLSTDTTFGRGLPDAFQAAAGRYAITVRARAMFTAAADAPPAGSIADTLPSLDAALNTIEASGARLVVLHGLPADCAAAVARMWQRGLLSGAADGDPTLVFGSSDWFGAAELVPDAAVAWLGCDASCAAQARGALTGAMGVDGVFLDSPATAAWVSSVWDPTVAAGDLTAQQVSWAGTDQWQGLGNVIYQYATTYDCVWSLALAMHDVCFGGVTAAVAAAAAGGGGDDAAAAVIDVSGGGTGGGVSPIAAPGEACGVDGTCMAIAGNGTDCVRVLRTPEGGLRVAAAAARIAFTGASGAVHLDSDGDRRVRYRVDNLQQAGARRDIGIVVPAPTPHDEYAVQVVVGATEVPLAGSFGCVGAGNCAAPVYPGSDASAPEGLQYGVSVRPQLLPHSACVEGDARVVSSEGDSFCVACPPTEFQRYMSAGDVSAARSRTARRDGSRRKGAWHHRR